MFTATPIQASTYLLGVCLFSISFLVFLNSTVSFVITKLIQERQGVGDAVGTLGFVDELVALIACPLWGILSDRIGVRTVCVLGYAIVGLSLLLFVQARNVYPQLLLARMFFSIGGAATATMVTAILPSMTAEASEAALSDTNTADQYRRISSSPSRSSELTITPARFTREASQVSLNKSSFWKTASPTRLAGVVGIFTGCGALVALGGFLPLPARFERHHVEPGRALAITYYIVGLIAIFMSFFCFLGLRNLNGENNKRLGNIITWSKGGTREEEVKPELSYWRLLIISMGVGLRDPIIGLGYLGGFVARASSVGISLFIPLYVNAYFQSSGLCKIDDATNVKSDCREAYILTAKLTGVSQLVALMCAPLFGYLADRYRHFHVPLLMAAMSGIVGYTGFASLGSPEIGGANGSPWVFAIVSLLGISQIGSIVCSLGVLGRGISSSEGSPNDQFEDRGHGSPEISIQAAENLNSVQTASSESRVSLDDETVERESESSTLLSNESHGPKSLSHLKGSIAGVYSLSGGAGILLLTKLGGFLFDVKSTSSPFYMLAVFNVMLLAGGLLCGSLQVY